MKESKIILDNLIKGEITIDEADKQLFDLYIVSGWLDINKRQPSDDEDIIYLSELNTTQNGRYIGDKTVVRIKGYDTFKWWRPTYR